LRYPLSTGQGNSVPLMEMRPLLVRYTEVGFSRIAERDLKDIEKDTVTGGPNYDES